MIRIFRAGLADFESLVEMDAARFHFQILGLVRRAENFHYQGQLGLLRDEDWEGLRASMLQLIGSPGARVWWRRNTELFNSSFRDFIERELRAREGSGGRSQPAVCLDCSCWGGAHSFQSAIRK